MEHNIIQQHFRELKLQGMLTAFQEASSASSMSAEQWPLFLEQLLEAELSHRQARSYAYRLKLAKLGQVKTFETFDVDFSIIPNEKLQQVRACEFIEKHENVILIGGSGSGKTHISLALAHKALQGNYRVKFYKFNQLVRELLSAQEHRYEARFMERILRFDLLIIDELGYLPVEQKAGALIFELLSGFYEKGSIVINTHLIFSEWKSIFGGEKLGNAIVDRMTHHCHLLETGDKSWRFKEVQGKK